MQEFRAIVAFWKRGVESHGKDQASHMVDAWLCYYLKTGINLANR